MPLFEELAGVLVDRGVASLNVNLFGGKGRETPTGDGPYVTIIDYAGESPRRVHNDVVAGVVLGTKSGENPRAQIICRARTFAAARLMARRCYRALNLRGVTLGTPHVATVSTLTRSGTVATATTAAAHGWVDGQLVTIAGANEAGYNGAHVIDVSGASAFTFPVSGSPASPATGSVTATFPGTWYREIEPMQEPFELGLDETGRPRVVFNLRIAKGPS